MTSTSLANPRRTTLAGIRSLNRCEVAGPECRGTATQVLVSAEGERPACAVCAQH